MLFLLAEVPVVTLVVRCDDIVGLCVFVILKRSIPDPVKNALAQHLAQILAPLFVIFCILLPPGGHLCSWSYVVELFAQFKSDMLLINLLIYLTNLNY